jgi:hypothetical protein
VRFASIEAANAAIASKNGLQIGTKCIKVQRIGSIRDNISGPRPFSNDLGAVHAKGHSNMQLSLRLALPFCVFARKVSIARPSGSDIQNSKLFVANLPLTYRQDCLNFFC